MTDSERADQIVAEIDGAIVAHTLESGEPWSKRNHDVLIPEDQFFILRRYYGWERLSNVRPRPTGQYDGRLQVVDLPRARVYNGGAIAEIQIERLMMFIRARRSNGTRLLKPTGCLSSASSGSSSETPSDS